MKLDEFNFTMFDQNKINKLCYLCEFISNYDLKYTY